MDKMTTEKIRKMLCREVDEIAEKGELSAGDLETIHKLTDTLKNIDKIEMLENEEYSQSGSNYSRTYSRDGEWNASGFYGRNGNSYDRGNSYGRDYRGRYSRADGMEMAEQIRMMMNDGSLNSQQRDALHRAIEQLER